MVRVSFYRPKKRDFRKLLGLLRQLWPGRKYKDIKEEFHKDRISKHFIVAKKSRKIVGFATVKPRFFGLVLHLNELVVNRKHRGKGIGKRLLARVVKVAKKKSCKFVLLTSAVRRKRAHKFYRANRFKAIYNVLYRVVS